MMKAVEGSSHPNPPIHSRSRIQHSAIPVVLAALAFAGAAFLCPLLGVVPIRWTHLWDFILQNNPDSPEARVLGASRLPRVLFALLAGSALSLAGTAMQALLRNPLAEPFTLGLSGGSTLTVLLVLQWGGGLALASTLPPGVLPLASVVGAFGALALVFLLARLAALPGSAANQSQVRPDSLILCGVVINTMTGAAIVLIQYLSNPFETAALLRWMLGGVDVATWTPSAWVAGALLLAGGTLFAGARTLDVLRLGDGPAHHLGVPVARARLILLTAAAILTAAVVAYAGPIAFVGLIVPHTVRLMTGWSHRILLPTAALAGGAFLAIADAVSRTILAPVELPVGILTALCGGPFFLGLLILRRGT